MSADIETARAAVVGDLAEWLGTDVRVEAHGGRFDRNELSRHSRRAPAVLVAAMGIPEVADTPQPATPTLQFTAFVMTRDAPGAPRDTQALTLVESVLRRLPGSRWGLARGQRPERINAENLYSGEIDQIGIAMWAISWRQALTLRPVKDVAELGDFAIYAAEHQVGDGPATESQAEIPTE